MKKLLLLLLLFPCKFIFAQDTIYRINHEKIVATVQEVDPDVIKYKRYGSTDGPLYVVKVNQITKIVYADGHVDTFNGSGNEYFSPKSNFSLALNSFDIMFGFASINAEYYFPKSGISVRAPISIGMAALQGKKVLGGYSSIDDYYYHRYKTYTAGLGVMFYPGHLSHTVNYFLGFTFEVGQIKKLMNWYPYPSTQEFTYNWYGTGIVNGVQIKLSDRINIGLDATVGMTVVNDPLYHYQDYRAMGRLDISLGIRIGNYSHHKQN